MDERVHVVLVEGLGAGVTADGHIEERQPHLRLDGPAVIEELGATILLYPGDEMQVNEFGHLVIDVGQ